MEQHTLDPTARMTLAESRDINEANLINENIQSPICTDDQNWVILRAWFKGDKRDGVDEVFYTCEAPPADIDDYIFTFIYDMTGLTRDLFKGATVIRIRDEKADATLQSALDSQPVEEIDDLQLILSMAQVMAEQVDPEKKSKRFPAIERWRSRSIRAKASLIMQQIKKSA